MTRSIVIAGTGPAGLETALALRDLAAERVRITLLGPDDELVYRPISVADPFAIATTRRYRIAGIAADLGVEWIKDAVAFVDADANTVTTGDGRGVRFDELVVATGADATPAFEHATTFWGPGDVERIHGLVQDVEGGYTRRIAFVVPPGRTWSLPLYELALLMAERAYASHVTPELHLVTPEDGPLALFGPRASAAVADELARAGVVVHLRSSAGCPADGVVTPRPSGERIEVDRVVALPQLSGRPVPGLAADGDGFLPVDRRGRVRGARHVFAAGDATDFPIKQGGLAAQQAGAVASAIAARSGAPIEPWPFHPVLRGMMLTGRSALWLQYDPSGGAGDGLVSSEALWSPPTKIAGRWLGPYLERRDAAASPPRTPLERRLDTGAWAART